MLSCAAPKQTKFNIETNYSNVLFNPNNQSKNISQNLKLTIEPVDAKNLNKEIYESSNLDGSYEKMFISSYISRVEDRRDLTPEEKRKLEMASIIESYLNELVADKKIDDKVALNFKEKVFYTYLIDKQYGWTGKEVDKLVFNERYNTINPYYIDGRYFSLFKITFFNSGKDVEEVDIKKMQVLNGNELLYPFNKDYFENTLKGDNERLKFIYRMNMPEIIKIVPNQSVVKYIAIPPINSEFKSLSINYVNDKQITDYNFSISTNKKTEKYVFNPYSILQTSMVGIKNFYVIQEGQTTFPLADNNFYINETSLNEQVKIYRLKIDSNRKKVSLEEKTVTPAEIKNGKVKISIK